MQIETLQIFLDLADAESFSEAARRNGITQSAVSQQIRTLEEKHEAVFFERGKKHFSITPEGEVFRDAAREIIETYRGIDGRLRELQNIVAGPLRIATILTLGLHELPPYLKRYKARFPGVEVEVVYRRTPQVYAEIMEGGADLGLVAYPAKRRGMVAEEFAKDELVLICSPDHPFAARKSVAPAELRRADLILFEPDMPTRKAIDKRLKEAGAPLAAKMEFDNIETVKRAVEVENGVSIVPRLTVAEEVADGHLRAIPFEPRDLWRPLGVIRKRVRPLTPAMREFIGGLMDGGIAG